MNRFISDDELKATVEEWLCPTATGIPRTDNYWGGETVGYICALASSIYLLIKTSVIPTMFFVPFHLSHFPSYHREKCYSV